MRILVRPLLEGEARSSICFCRLCLKAPTFIATVVGLRDFPICLACLNQPEKPSGNSLMQRLLQRSGGHGFIWERPEDRRLQLAESAVSA